MPVGRFASSQRRFVLMMASNTWCPGYVATDLNQHTGLRTVQQGAEIAVRLATLPDAAPTGGFFNDAGPVPW